MIEVSTAYVQPTIKEFDDWYNDRSPDKAPFAYFIGHLAHTRELGRLPDSVAFLCYTLHDLAESNKIHLFQQRQGPHFVYFTLPAIPVSSKKPK